MDISLVRSERERITDERLGLFPHLVGLLGDELVFGRVIDFWSITGTYSVRFLLKDEQVLKAVG